MFKKTKRGSLTLTHLTDRLGSVRNVMHLDGTVANSDNHKGLLRQVLVLVIVVSLISIFCFYIKSRLRAIPNESSKLFDYAIASESSREVFHETEFLAKKI